MTLSSLQMALLFIFLYSSISIRWDSIVTLFFFLISILIEKQKNQNVAVIEKQRNPDDAVSPSPNSEEKDVLKRNKDSFSSQTVWDMEHAICLFVTYEADEVESINNFEIIKKKSPNVKNRCCQFWGSPDWKWELTLEENILRTVPTFFKYVCMMEELNLGGFVYEIPGSSYGQNIYEFAEAVNVVVTILSDNDPAAIHCIDSSVISTNDWIFEFNSVKMNIITFAPFYSKESIRYTYNLRDCYILFQTVKSCMNEHTPSCNTAQNCDKLNERMLFSNYTIVLPIDEDSRDLIEWWDLNKMRKKQYEKFDVIETQKKKITEKRKTRIVTRKSIIHQTIMTTSNILHSFNKGNGLKSELIEVNDDFTDNELGKPENLTPSRKLGVSHLDKLAKSKSSNNLDKIVKEKNRRSSYLTHDLICKSKSRSEPSEINQLLENDHAVFYNYFSSSSTLSAIPPNRILCDNWTQSDYEYSADDSDTNSEISDNILKSEVTHTEMLKSFIECS